MAKQRRDYPDLTIPHWYIVWAVESEKVSQMLEWILCIAGQTGYSIWVPRRNIEDLNGNVIQRSLYPGYMFVNCIWSPNIEESLRGMYKGTCFLRSDNCVYIMREEDLTLVKETEQKHQIVEKETDLIFKVGDNVQVVVGPFENQVGVVEKLSKRFIHVKLFIMGRVVTVPFSYEVIEKISTGE